MRIALLAAVLMLGLAAGADAQDTIPKVTVKIKKQPNLISQEEIQAVRDQVRSARDIVDQLRPQYLRVRARGSQQGNPEWSSGPRVMVDDVSYGDVESLRTIEAGSVREIRYVSGPEAASRYGAEYNGGVILILRR